MVALPPNSSRIAHNLLYISFEIRVAPYDPEKTDAQDSGGDLRSLYKTQASLLRRL
jgi:hypothetical protein